MMSFKLKIAKMFYLLLLITGLAIYVTWSAVYNTWTDIGLYSLTIVMVLLGLFGFLLYGKDREEFHIEEEV
ncbi:MAG: hypothetical protein QCI38_06770 [Candidatus Thermoplasmatota archaeon]|nr:hypothetical protein [Candidatus Thermoplasmatota archaeon]